MYTGEMNVNSSSSSSSIEYLYSASGALKPQKRYLLPLH